MKNSNDVSDAKKMINEAFKLALKDISVKKIFMKYLKLCAEHEGNRLEGLASFGEGIFEDAAPKSIQKALYKFKDITEQYWIPVHKEKRKTDKELIEGQAVNMHSDINEIWSLVSNSDEVEFSDAEIVERIYKLLSNKSNK